MASKLVNERIVKLVKAIKTSIDDLSKGYDNNLTFIKNKLGFGEETHPKAKSVEVQLSPDRLEQYGIPDTILDRIKKECNKDYPDVCYSLVHANIELRTLIDINKKGLSNNILARCKCQHEYEEDYNEQFNDYVVAEEVLKNKELLKCVTIAVLAFLIYKIEDVKNVAELIEFIKRHYKQYKNLFPSIFFNNFALEDYIYYEPDDQIVYIPYDNLSMMYDVMIRDSKFLEKFNQCLEHIERWSIVGNKKFRNTGPNIPGLCKKQKMNNRVVVYQHGTDSCLYFIS